MLAFQCPKCQKTLKAPEERAGADSQCPYCRCPVQVPASSGAPVAVRAVPVETLTKNAVDILPFDVPPTRFQCPTCKAILEYPNEQGGNKLPCPKCGQRLLVPLPIRSVPMNKTVLGEPIPVPQIPQRDAAITSSLSLPQPQTASSPLLPSALQMAVAKPWWRPVSPSLLVIALLVFPLPWVEISCSGGAMGGKVLSTQSGFQSIYGGITTAIPTPPGKENEWDAERREKLKKCGFWERFAPPMLVYAPLLAIAVFIGFLLRPSRLRAALIAVPAGLAFLLLLLQVGIGFPLERMMNKAMMEMAASKNDPKGMEGFGAAVALAFDVRYTGWFWIGLLSIITALLTISLEWFSMRSTGGSGLPSWIKTRPALVFLERWAGSIDKSPPPF